MNKPTNTATVLVNADKGPKQPQEDHRAQKALGEAMENVNLTTKKFDAVAEFLSTLEAEDDADLHTVLASSQERISSAIQHELKKIEVSKTGILKSQTNMLSDIEVVIQDQTKRMRELIVQSFNGHKEEVETIEAEMKESLLKVDQLSAKYKFVVGGRVALRFGGSIEAAEKPATPPKSKR